MKRRKQRGFTLVEFVIAIVFIAVVLGPFLTFVSRLHDLNSAVGQQGRREAWRSFHDQAVLAGIDPTRAPALASGSNPSVPAAPALAVESSNVAPTPGVACIVPLHIVLDGTVAEPRLAGAGFQIGAGAAVAPRSTPSAPLVPIVMPIPVMNPPDGAVIPTSSLVAGLPGAPFTTDVQATSEAGAKVLLSFNQPHTTAQGMGRAQRTVSATDLMARVNGTAWTEYSGSNTDQSTTLGDGRTRWFVTRSDGRLQIYEPSPIASFAYQLGLGAPIVAWGAQENTAGSALAFDYGEYVAVQNGANALRLDFPAAVKAVFGNAWPSGSVGFQWTFHDVAGPWNGDLKSFFSSDTLSLWGDTVVIAATPVVPAGANADSATWTFTRTKLALGVPVLSSPADAAGFYSPGQLQFTAPNGPDGSPIGRLSFDNGATLSTGATLTVAVIP